MDALSSLAIACAVVQFIDAGLGTAKVCKEIYDSADGITHRNVELEESADRLRAAIEALNLPLDGANNTASSVLDTLRKKCLATAEELTKILNTVKVAKDKNAALRVVSGTFKTLLKGRKIEKVEKQLRSYASELDSHIIADIHGKLDKASTINSDAFKSLNKDLQELAKALLQGHHTTNAIVSATKSDVIQSVAEKFDQLKLDAEQQADDERLRRSLFFPEIWSREEQIKPAHKNTYHWIFAETHTYASNRASITPVEAVSESAPGVAQAVVSDNDDTNISNVKVAPTLDHSFTDWLRSEDKPYWICGKAGSGKSTLVNYINSETETLNSHLKKWSGDKKIITPRVFLWRQGSTTLQKGVIGLLRSLLYQIVNNAKHLTNKLYEPGQLSEEIITAAWTEPRLLAALHRILKVDDRPHIFFVLDGLDEIADSPQDLLNIIDSICEFPRVKICLSSRPGLIFGNHFKQNPKLRLEELTRGDIKLYIKERLQNEAESSDELDSLIERITDKAQGVFIWVKYALESMIEGFRNMDSVQQLEERLHDTPSELKELYAQMFKDLRKSYKPEAALIFQLALFSLREHNLPELSIYVMAYFEDEFAKYPAQQIARTQVANRLEMFKVHLRTRCLGLLEITSNPDPRHFFDWPGELVDVFNLGLQFMHRTAADYVDSAFKSGELPELAMPELKLMIFKSYNRFLYMACVTRWIGPDDEMSRLQDNGWVEWTRDSQPVSFFDYLDLRDPVDMLLYWSGKVENTNKTLVWNELDLLAQKVVFFAQFVVNPGSTVDASPIMKCYQDSLWTERPSLFAVHCALSGSMDYTIARLPPLDTSPGLAQRTFLLEMAIQHTKLLSYGEILTMNEKLSTRLKLVRTILEHGGLPNTLCIRPGADKDIVIPKFRLVSPWIYFVTLLWNSRIDISKKFNPKVTASYEDRRDALIETIFSFIRHGADLNGVVLDRILIRLLDELKYRLDEDVEYPEAQESRTWVIYALIDIHFVLREIFQDHPRWTALEQHFSESECSIQFVRIDQYEHENWEETWLKNITGLEARRICNGITLEQSNHVIAEFDELSLSRSHIIPAGEYIFVVREGSEFIRRIVQLVKDSGHDNLDRVDKSLESGRLETVDDEDDDHDNNEDGDDNDIHDNDNNNVHDNDNDNDDDHDINSNDNQESVTKEQIAGE